MSVYVETEGQPICPRDPDHPAHRAVVATLNRAYEVAPRTADGEMSEDVEAIYGAADHGQEKMSLRVHQAGIRPGVHGLSSHHVYAEAAWWTCNVCGFVLPAALRAQ